MSMEFLMGRSLTNAMVNLGMDSEVEEGVYEVRKNLLCNCMLVIRAVCIW